MKVVIVGGGFGGVRAALNLANRRGTEVRLITSQSYFEYHAALYRSATGRSPLEVVIPLAEFFAYAKNVEVVEDTVIDLDANQRVVRGQSSSRYEYDILILALGSTTAYYGIKGLKRYAYGIKTIQEALKLKRHLHEQLLKAESDRHYVVIGAGATGVELSAELVAYLQKIRRKHNITHSFSVDLVEAANRPLPNMPTRLSRIVTRRLKRVGVRLFINTRVESESVDEIELSSGPINSRTVVWTAGVTNNPFFAAFPQVFDLTPRRRVRVDEYLAAAPGIFVIGDAAETPYSGMAQTALHDANLVTTNLMRQLRGHTPRPYRPKRPIYAIPVGPRWAAVLWGKVVLSGRFGWALRRLADLRLYLTFLPLRKALTTWRYGFVDDETCPVCKQ